MILSHHWPVWKRNPKTKQFSEGSDDWKNITELQYNITSLFKNQTGWALEANKLSGEGRQKEGMGLDCSTESRHGFELPNGTLLCYNDDDWKCLT